MITVLVVKIDNDIGKMEMLLTDLKKFTESNYTRQVGDINHEEIPSLIHELESLKAAAHDLRPNLTKSQETLTTDDYIETIQSNAVVLTNTEMPSIPLMWQMIGERLAEPYQHWGWKYMELREKFQSGQKDDLTYNESLSFNEREFLQQFAAIQALARILAAMDSATF